jgi:hypothetical protein
MKFDIKINFSRIRGDLKINFSRIRGTGHLIAKKDGDSNVLFK